MYVKVLKGIMWQFRMGVLQLLKVVVSVAGVFGSVEQFNVRMNKDSG